MSSSPSILRRIAAVCSVFIIASLWMSGAAAHADDSDVPASGSQTSLSQAPAPDAGNQAPADGGSASVQTGDAASDVSAQNQVNTNTTTATSSASTTVADTNTATLDNTASSSADTGDNTASGGSSATIVTGSAVSTANVINVVNTTIVNSDGFFAFLNSLTGGTVDLRNYDLSYFFGNGASDSSGSTAGRGTCSLSSCADADSSLTVSTANTATVHNTVLVKASTGGNSASSAGGDASVSSGDAVASANVVNVVNTNIVDSHYLLLALNNFGDMTSDITLPDAAFFEKLLAGSAGLSGHTSVQNTNNADVTNTTTALAQTGGNTANAGADASVHSGNAVSGATTVNQVNSNFTGGSTVYMLVNIIGDWTGTVQGLPAGMQWVKTPTGIAIIGGANPLDTLAGNGASSSQDLTARTTNAATVTNDVRAYALTGDNFAGAATGSASVSSGNAYSSANVVNIVNTNVIGQNWMLAIFNIFGNFSGNIAFGHPDLWIGTVVEGGSPAQPGGTVPYHFTVANRGDADATNVVLHASFDGELLSFADGSLTDDGVEWVLGDIPKGASKDFTFDARAANVPHGTTVAVPLSATLTEDQTDDNMADNTDNVTAQIGEQIITYGGAFAPGRYTINPKLTVTKTASINTGTIPLSVDYKVVVTNDEHAGPAYHAQLEDRLVGPDGATVSARSWDLDEIDPGDEYDLTYTVEFNASTTPGVYTNTADVYGQQGNPVSLYANDMKTVSASSTITLAAGAQKPAGMVLGANTVAPKCAAFITSYIKPGAKNNNVDQVRRLQFFLRDFEHAALTPTGIYDAVTIAALKAFQQKYASDILEPWKMTDPSGYVYITTQNKINNEFCQGVSNFPLTKEQASRIKASR